VAAQLIVNADDFGMYDAINEAVVRAFAVGIVRSTSLMVPCPGAAEAMRLLDQPVEPVFRHVERQQDVLEFPDRRLWRKERQNVETKGRCEFEARQHQNLVEQAAVLSKFVGFAFVYPPEMFEEFKILDLPPHAGVTSN
jgi:hypothetical protein